MPQECQVVMLVTVNQQGSRELLEMREGLKGREKGAYYKQAVVYLRKGVRDGGGGPDKGYHNCPGAS